jgi:FG-GAP-like repeat
MALNIGDVIFNEFVSDNNTNLSTGNDYFELLVLTDGADLRGLRVSDNEITPTSNNALNINESVYTFGQDSYLQSVAKGTVIAVYTNPANLSVQTNIDTTASAAAGDWKLVLQDGSGVTISTDGLGGSLNPGLSTTGEGLYLYLPGADGNSGGTDNIYLDYISYGIDSAEAPTGLVDLNLPDSGSTTPAILPALPQADEGYYIGNTAAGNDLAANWITYDTGAAGSSNTIATPGEANVGQDLSSLRIITPAIQAVKNDFNGDGKSDLLWRSTSGDTYIYQQNSFAITQEGSVRNVSTDWKVAGTGDFDADGKSDIVWRNNITNEAYLYRQNGLSVTAEGSLGVISANITIAGIGDFNGNGRSEILCRDSNGDVLISNVNGFALSAPALVRNVSLDWQIAGTGDFNGDNNSDILWRNSNTGDVYTYLMNGTAVIGEGIIRNAVTSDWVIEGIDDFDGNGKDDILWRNSNSGAVYGYLMNGTSISAEGFIGAPVSVASGWDISGTGDINGDNKGDVLWRNSGSGDVYAWELNGLSVLSEGFIRQGVSNSYQVVAPTI